MPTSKQEFEIIMALPQESRGLFEKAGWRVHYSGIGKINAAACAMELILKTGCKRVVNFGSAGSHKLAPHILIECKAFVQRDMDLSLVGCPIGKTPLDPIEALLEVDTFTDLTKGVCGTGDNIEIGTTKLPCDLVDMEAYAIAKVCRKMGVRFTAIKYITDASDAAAHKEWSTNLESAATGLFSVLSKL